MSSVFPCRLLIDPPQSGAWNMAVDEALLADAAVSGIATLRFYEWSEPTLSLGYFQKFADWTAHAASASAAAVRRQSGGGAIMHDRELTYSLALPPHHPFAINAQSLYNTVHERIAAVLRKQLSDGDDPTTVSLNCCSQKSKDRSEPFLCFERRSPGDIVFSQPSRKDSSGDHKIVGSAQRRHCGAVLQHGSLLIERSSLASELAGWNDLCDNELTTAFLIRELPSQLLAVANIEVREQALPESLRIAAITLQAEKYGNRLWTERR